MLLQSSFISASFGAVTIIGDGSASSWALPELKEAMQNGLTYDGIMNNFQKPITREEFCIIVVKLYEKISGKAAVSGENPFQDTNNSEIVKAYLLGIVKGTGANTFSPETKITRQELSVMIMRAIKAAIPNLPTESPALKGYKDTGKIAPWADAAVRFAVRNEIIKGVGSGLIDPLGNTTREQAIAIINRTYQRYKVQDYSNMPTLDISSNSKSLLSEKDKFTRLNLVDRVSSPRFDTRLSLLIATKAGKPPLPALSGPSISTFALNSGSLTTPPIIAPPIIAPPIIAPPIIAPPIITPPTRPEIGYKEPDLSTKLVPKTDFRYSATPFQFIESTGDLKRYFAFNLNNANPFKVVWQVSKAPFNGYSDNWNKPNGLVASGEVSASVKEFVIDFSKFALPTIPPANLWQLNSGQFIFKTTSSYRELPREQRIYYVRAVPVDSKGNVIGDPGTGLPVIYGKPVTDRNLANVVQPSFELWCTARDGAPSSNGEFPNSFKNDSRTIGVSPGSSKYYFQPQKFDLASTKVFLQVSTVPFKNEPVNWDKPSGLVYNKGYDIKNMPMVNGFENALQITFADFSPTSAQLGKQKIVYYVRSVALKYAESQAGRVVPIFSNVRTVEYYNPEPTKMLETKTIIVPAYTPTMTFERYIPVSWEDPEWASYYEVFRAPKWHEVNFKLKKNDGSILYPYGFYMLQGMSTTEYENNLVPKFLVKGSGFKVVYNQAEKSWWGDLWDGIVDFFSSIVKIITDVVNWASSTFNSLKLGIINVIAANFPLIPDNWRDELTLALTALADYGLASIGIPPNLPNFDELMSGGLDYAITVAAQEAGIPANALTDAGKSKLEEEIKKQAAASTSVKGPNPLNCEFIKPDHRKQYSPAYIDVKLYNNNLKPSPTGTLMITAQDEKWPYFPVYDYVSIPVPSLEPKETLPIRVYLKEYMNKPYPGDIPFMPSDFNDMYWGSKGKQTKFNISISYNLPDVKQAAKAKGLDKNQGDYILNFIYDKPSTGITFTGVPCNSHF